MPRFVQSWSISGLRSEAGTVKLISFQCALSFMVNYVLRLALY